MRFQQIIVKLKRRLAIRLGILIEQSQAVIARQSLPQFGNNPKNPVIELPRRIANPKRIFLGDDVRLGPNCLLVASTQFPGVTLRHPDKPDEVLQTFDSKITIGNRVTATAGLQIIASSEITIEDDVMFASNINITDAFHGYQTANQPYKYQPMEQIAPITIKQGCWIGQNVLVLPGVTIGEFAIIGANSIVNKDIPPRTIAVGNPARIIKVWNEHTQAWDANTHHKDEPRTV